MTELASIELEQDMVDAAAERAAQEGLSATAYLSLLLRRTFERAPGEQSILVYDHVHGDGKCVLDREVGETDEDYQSQ